MVRLIAKIDGQAFSKSCLGLFEVADAHPARREVVHCYERLGMLRAEESLPDGQQLFFQSPRLTEFAEIAESR